MSAGAPVVENRHLLADVGIASVSNPVRMLLVGEPDLGM
jgi:hypothetical protein